MQKTSRKTTATNMKLVNDTIERLKKNNNEKDEEGLEKYDPKTPKFYLRTKIHKELNPGRPVVSSMNCHNANISKYVDYHLQPIVTEIPSHVKDTKFFQKVRESKRHTSRESSSYIRRKVTIYKHSK